MWVTLVYLRTVQNIFAQKSIFSEIRDFEILTKISFFSENYEIDILDAIFSAKTPYMMLIMAILKEYNFLNHIIGEKIMAPILHWNPGPQNCYFLDFLLFRRKISQISELYPNFCLDTMIVILQQCPKTIQWGWSQVADSK